VGVGSGALALNCPTHTSPPLTGACVPASVRGTPQGYRVVEERDAGHSQLAYGACTTFTAISNP
jgi:hypothetical protein